MLFIRGCFDQLVLIVLLACLGGFSGFAEPAWGADRSVVIVGTGDSQRLLHDLGRAYERLHPGRQVVIPESIGSSGGIRAVIEGDQVMARVARKLTSEELQAGLERFDFALTPVVFAVNASVSRVDSLNRRQLQGIFAEQLVNWADVGGKDAPVYLVNREAGDSSRRVIARFIPGFDGLPTRHQNTFYSTPEAMAALATYPDTIGYGPLVMVPDEGVRVLNFEGVAPTKENVTNGIYPMIIRLGLVWRNDLPVAYREFLAFLRSSATDTICFENGAVPVRLEKE